MTIKYKLTTKNSRLNQINTDIGASGLMRWYSGTRPATVDTALSGNTKLAELPLSATAFATASASSMVANAISTEASADNTGTATWGTLCTSAGVRVVDFDIATSASDLNLNTTSIVAGGQASCSGVTLNENN